MPFTFTPAGLAGVILIEPRVFADDRGAFLETYKRSDFVSAGIAEAFVQDNQSISQAGVLRGLHYQLDPHAQGKLVRVTSGRAWDVAVDIRRDSPTFGKWVGFELSGENYRMLYIPPGFAHGFLALEDDTHLGYKCTAEYDTASEAGIRWDDADLGITWPRTDVVLSEKDAALPPLAEARLP
jgi:dTDP-4-dehydrorhamnose 3,5-epimerase